MFSAGPSGFQPWDDFSQRQQPLHIAVCPQTPINRLQTQLYGKMTVALLSNWIYRQ